MSDTTINTQQLETNWNNIANGGTRTDGLVKIDAEKASDDLYWNFSIACPQYQGCGGHLNLKHGFSTAHVTLNGWNKERKANYWYKVSKNPSNAAQPIVEGVKPPGSLTSDIPGTSVSIDTAPGEIKDAIKRLVRDTYANCF